MNRAIKNTTLLLACMLCGSSLLLGQTKADPSRIIEMTNTNSYNPAELIVKQGEQITWQNNSNEVQTITVKTTKEKERIMASAPADAEPFSSGAINPGESFSYTFYISGTYELVSLTDLDRTPAKIVVEE